MIPSENNGELTQKTSHFTACSIRECHEVVKCEVYLLLCSSESSAVFYRTFRS